jgi:deoxyribose-phosphate aldolase
MEYIVSEPIVDRIVQELLDAKTREAGSKEEKAPYPERLLEQPMPQPSVAGYNPDHVLACGADRVSCTLGYLDRVRAEIGRMIDHTLLAPDGSKEEVTLLCREALEYRFASVCINPYRVPLAASLLKGSTVKVCTVIGFPLGANQTKTKAQEARLAVRDGAQEVDMVVNVGAVLDGDWSLVERDIRDVVEAAGTRTVTKVILETCLLTDEQIVKASVAARKAGANFVKTSTGFSSGGATAEHVALMRRVVGAGMGVKASGGVRNLNDAVNMIESGADRIGASASIAIVGGRGPKGGGY